MSIQRDKVVVWKTRWLESSETFIRNQSDGLSVFDAVPAGFIRIPSPLVRTEDSIVFGTGSVLDKFRLRLLRLTGRSRQVEKFLRVTGPSLVHAHFAGNGMDIIKSARRAGIPAIVTLHGNDVTGQVRESGWRGLRYRRRLRRLFSEVTLLIAVSEPIRKCALELGAHPDRIVTHHMGIPLSDRSSAKTESIDVLFVGRLVEKKGVEDLLLALSVLRPELGLVRTVVVGSGPLEAVLRARATELGVSVEFWGTCDPEQVRAAMEDAKLLAVPSKVASTGDREGLPTVILEAASLGLPVVGYAHSGIPEAVIDGESGLLADEGDWKQLGILIERVLVDNDFRLNLGLAAQLYCQEHFDMTKQCQILESIYEDVIHGRMGKYERS